MKEIKTTDQLIQHLREDANFYGYRADIEPREQLLRSSIKPYAAWRASFDVYDWEPPDEIDPRPWYDIHDQGPVGSCFPAGAKVTMADGSLRNIEDVRVGEYVLTHHGRARRVVNAMSRQFSGDMYTVFVKGWGRIRMTNDHRVLNVDRWVRADNLNEGDELVVALGVSNPVSQIDLSSYVSGDKVLSDDGQCFRRVMTSQMLPVSIDVDAELCFILGLYAAEGSCDRSKYGAPCRATWTLHEDETDLVSRLRRYFVRFGLEAQVSKKPHSRAINVRVGSVEFAEFLESVVGKFCNRKEVPSFVSAGTAEQKREFIRGWMAGDGTYRKMETGRVVGGNQVVCRQIVGYTASRVLAQQISTMLVSLGMKPVRSITKARSHQQHTSYAVYLYAGDACLLSGIDVAVTRPTRRSLNWGDYGQLRPIREIDVNHVDDVTVFDIEVEEDHSFVCQGIVVHNCQGQSLGDSGEYLNVIANGVEVQLSRGWAYLASQEFDGLLGGDNGSTLSGGTKAAARGIPLESEFPYTANYRDLLSRYKANKSKILAGALYKFPTGIALPDWESLYRWLSSYSGIVQIGISWSLGGADWEVSSYSQRGGGHAVILGGYLKRAGWKDGVGALLKNSHSTQWARDGWALINPTVVDTWCKRQTVVGRSDMKAPTPRIESSDHYREHVAA